MISDSFFAHRSQILIIWFWITFPTLLTLTSMLQTLIVMPIRMGGRMWNVDFFSSSNTDSEHLDFIAYCCVTNYYKLRDLRWYTFIISQFPSVRSPSWGLCSKPHQAETKPSAGQCSQLEFRILFEAHSSFWQNSVACKCRTEVLVFLLADDQLSAPTFHP